MRTTKRFGAVSGPVIITAGRFRVEGFGFRFVIRLNYGRIPESRVSVDEDLLTS